MKETRVKEKAEVSLDGQGIGVAGYTPSCLMYGIGTWEPYIQTQLESIISISRLMSSTPQETPSVDINREVGEVPIVILEYEDGFTVYPLEIDGVVSQGNTLPQAIDNVKEAISLYIESFGKNKLIPKNERAVRVFASKTTVSL